MTSQTRFDFRQDLFDYPCQDFKRHLQTDGNSRILFSGKFGIGKSFFLDHFFIPKVQVTVLSDVKYEAFHIFPVNYSIASNEDIFRYIKYDVIITMLSKEIKLDYNDFSYLESIPSFLKGNLLKTLATLIYMIPKVGKPVYESYQKLEELNKEFLKHHESIKEPEGAKLTSFIERIENKEGSLFENDIISAIIQNVLHRRKIETQKENVLIIDDLDRIDPEHVFRLLNVFAAHFDNPNGLANKLGFDKVIIVCDIKNIRNIFKAKYGSDTDFNGYIDKFYSIDVYNFDNREVLLNISLEAFRNVLIHGLRDHELDLYKRNSAGSLAYELLQLFIANSFVSLRTLKNRIDYQTEVDARKYIKFNDLSTIEPARFPVFIHFKILKEIVGGYDVVKDLISRVNSQSFLVENMNKYSNFLLFFLNYKSTFRAKGFATIFFNGQRLNYPVTANAEKDANNAIVFQVMGGNENKQYDYTLDEFRMLLLEFIDLLKRVDN